MPPKRPRKPGRPPWAKGHGWGFTQARFRRWGPPFKADYLLDLKPSIPDILITGRGGLPQREGDVSRRFRTFPFPRVFPPGIEVLDDFEDADMSDYEGQTGWYAVESAAKKEGNYGLRGQSDGSTRDIYVPGNHTAQGDLLKFWMMFPAVMQPDRRGGMLYGASAGGHWYQAGLDLDGALLVIYRDWTIVLGTTALGALSPDTWYQLSLDWKVGGDMILSWSGGAQTVEVNDETYSSGGYGWATVDEFEDPWKIYYDYLTKE